jgi:hypothetical protein
VTQDDIEAIKRLKARYFRLLDTKRWDEWGLVFTADAMMELPEADAVVHSRDEIVGGVSAALDGARTVHHGHMPEIQLTGDDTATGIWAMEDFVEWASPDGPPVGLHGYGHYVEEYRRDDGEWRIARTRLERLRVDPLG